MVEQDLGQATIAYEDADGETAERTVQNEHVAYFQDHWIVKTGEDDEGRDLVRRIPAQRVYYVERTVEQFEEEVSTLRDQVQSVADDLRTRILGGREEETVNGPEVHRIDVETEARDDSEESDDDRS